MFTVSWLCAMLLTHLPTFQKLKWELMRYNSNADLQAEPITAGGREPLPPAAILLFSLLHFRSSNLFPIFSFHFCLFTSYSSSFLLFQPSFPHSLVLLNLNLSSTCSSSSSLSTSFLLLFFLFFSFLPLFLFLFISQLHQCDDFLNCPCHFLGAVLPATALYPSLVRNENNIEIQLASTPLLSLWNYYGIHATSIILQLST